MRSYFKCLKLAIVIVVHFLAAPSHANNFIANIFLQRNSSDPEFYSIRLEGNDHSIGGVSVQPTASIFTAPDGTIFDPANSSLSGLTLEQVVSRFTGIWTIEDVDVSPESGPSQYHEFTIEPGEILVPPFQPVLSPAPGATVPPIFDVHIPPDGILGEFDVTDMQSHREFDDHVQITMKALASGQVSKDVTLAVSNVYRGFAALGNPLLPNPTNRFRVYMHSASLALIPLTVVVPEPATISLGTAGLLALVAARRKPRSTQRGNAAQSISQQRQNLLVRRR